LGPTSGWPTILELGLLPDHKSGDRHYGFARARSAELLSNALKNFIGQSVILHGASQYSAADHCRRLKYGFFSVSTIGAARYSHHSQF
jgi:hypothetical protein